MDQIISTLRQKKDTINDFFKSKFSKYPWIIYSSVDIRNAGFKITPIDANVFPAGFNNMCDIDKDNSSEIFKKCIKERYGDIKTILLLTEDNTRNLFYWDNVYTIYSIVREAGFECLISMATHMEKASITTSSGRTLQLSDVEIQDGIAIADSQYKVDLILSNNDFTLKNNLLENIQQPLNPPYLMGWFNRKKSIHLEYYHKVVNELCCLLDIDPWHFSLKSQVIAADKLELEKLFQTSKQVMEEITKDYQDRQIKSKPFLFVKNNSGTYGMGVIPLKNPEDILKWGKKEKARIKTGKLKSIIHELIIQEGVPSCLSTDEGYIAEPVIYMIGDSLVGGFLRTHGKKSKTDNLNSPGSVFKKFCMTDMQLPQSGNYTEDVYAIIARLSAVAIAMEAKNIATQP